MRFRIALPVLFVGLVAAWASRERPVTTSFDAPIASAASPAQQVAALKTTPTPSIPAFRAMPDGGFAPVMPSIKEEGRWKNPAKPVEPTFPAHFSEAVRVRSGGADVRATPVGGNPASTPRVSEDGSLVYADAFPGCDVKYRCERLKTEEFIVVKDATAQTAWSWDLETNGLTPRYTPMDTVELIDGNGVPRLRIDAPFGADAKGKKLRVGEALAFKVDGRRLTLTADLKGCAFPVEIDPSWSSTGVMTIRRSGHTATALADGRVLVAGGNTESSTMNSCESYDPVNGIWSVVPGMATTRSGHSAFRLPSGEILVAGGYQNVFTAFLSEGCEIYNPGLNSWRTSAVLPNPVFDSSFTALADGRIVRCGGENSSDCTVFNPADEMWTPIGSLGTVRRNHAGLLLPDGRVLVSGGLTQGPGGTTVFSSCEVLDPTTLTWSDLGALTGPRESHKLFPIGAGQVLVFSGLNGLNGVTRCELFDTATGQSVVGPDPGFGLTDTRGVQLNNSAVLVTGGPLQLNTIFYDPSSAVWSAAPSMSIERTSHTLTVLNDGRVLCAGGFGGYNGTGTYYASSEVLDPRPTAASINTTTNVNVPLPVSPVIGQGVGAAPAFVLVTQPVHGTLSGAFPDFTYTPAVNFIGEDTIEYRAVDRGMIGATAVIRITVLATPPAITSGPLATPNPASSGENVQFAIAATDAESLTYAWNFGDGSSGTGASPTHTYAAVGEYNAVVTITDAAGTVTTGGVLVKVSSKPTARFTTTDIVAFEGLPFGFDATFSTDPENAIVAYTWDFGDGTPIGTGEEISKIYAQAGTYTATLTITDAAGQTATASRVIEVLDESQVGLFNSEVAYSVKWDRQKTNADALTFSATVNVGDTAVGVGTNVALEIAGSSFAGTLDKRLTDKRNKNAVWSVKAGTRKQGVGEVALAVKIKKANLGLGFNLAGAVAGNNPKETVRVPIPVRLEVAGRVFELMLDSEFKFSKGGSGAKGSGEGP